MPKNQMGYIPTGTQTVADALRGFLTKFRTGEEDAEKKRLERALYGLPTEYMEKPSTLRTVLSGIPESERITEAKMGALKGISTDFSGLTPEQANLKAIQEYIGTDLTTLGKARGEKYKAIAELTKAKPTLIPVPDGKGGYTFIEAPDTGKVTFPPKPTAEKQPEFERVSEKVTAQKLSAGVPITSADKLTAEKYYGGKLKFTKFAEHPLLQKMKSVLPSALRGKEKDLWVIDGLNYGVLTPDLQETIAGAKDAYSKGMPIEQILNEIRTQSGNKYTDIDFATIRIAIETP